MHEAVFVTAFIHVHKSMLLKRAHTVVSKPVKRGHSKANNLAPMGVFPANENTRDQSATSKGT